MIEEKLEIVIPTYNRGNLLDKTLNSLFNSPLKNCRITIRDNASRDNTPDVCEKYSKLFSNLCIIRNDMNIGGNANILRSYENVSYPYIWVLADNDTLNLDDCDEFISAIESNKYDLIICCSGDYVHQKYDSPTFEDNGAYELIKEYRDNDENYLENNAQDLALILKKYFFMITSFIPSVVYRKPVINEESIMKGYDYISLSYPHFPFILRALNENLLTYKTKKDLVLKEKNPDDWEISNYNWYVRYIRCALDIKDKKIQQYMVQCKYDQSFMYTSLAQLILAKAENEENLKEKIFHLIGTILELKGMFKGFLYSIYLLSGYYFIPRKFCVYLYNKKAEAYGFNKLS